MLLITAALNLLVFCYMWINQRPSSTTLYEVFMWLNLIWVPVSVTVWLLGL